MKSTEIIKSLLLTLLALLLNTGFCIAQCPQDQEPEEPLAPREWLDQDYQPSRYDQDDETVLRRRRFNPLNYDPTQSYPTVISIPATVYRSGDCDGSPKQRTATKDLTDAGYLVFQVEHRLSPDGLIWGQDQHDQNTQKGRESGRPPQQTNDIKQQILAALADPHCNQKIFLLGGSSGGSHALWAALDPAATVPEWNANKVATIKAVASLSGPTNLPSREANNQEIEEQFELSVENYTDTDTGVGDWEAKQYDASPIKLVESATYIPPIRLYATNGDSVPWQQGEDMFDALFERGANVVFYKILGTGKHAFNYWHEVNTVTTECVSEEVIAFFDEYR